MSQIKGSVVEKAHYVERILDLIHTAIENPDECDWRKAAVPYYIGYPTESVKGKINRFPDEVGVYAIIRLFNQQGRLKYRVLYVGLSGNLRKRMSHHFGRIKSNPDDYDGSRFLNAVWEIVQDDKVVYNILNNDMTRIAILPLPEVKKEYLEAIEHLCIQVLNPLLNIKE